MVVLDEYKFNKSYRYMVLYDLFHYGLCEALVLKETEWTSNQLNTIEFFDKLAACFHHLNRLLVYTQSDSSSSILPALNSLFIRPLPCLQMVCIHNVKLGDILTEMLMPLQHTLTHLYITTRNGSVFMTMRHFIHLKELTHLVFINAQPLGQLNEQEDSVSHTLDYFSVLSGMPNMVCVSIPHSILKSSTAGVRINRTNDTYYANVLPKSLTTFYISVEKSENPTEYHIYSDDDGYDNVTMCDTIMRFVSSAFLNRRIDCVPTPCEFFKYTLTKQTPDIQLDLLDRLVYCDKAQ